MGQKDGQDMVQIMEITVPTTEITGHPSIPAEIIEIENTEAQSTEITEEKTGIGTGIGREKEGTEAERIETGTTEIERIVTGGKGMAETL